MYANVEENFDFELVRAGFLCVDYWLNYVVILAFNEGIVVCTGTSPFLAQNNHLLYTAAVF